MSTAGESGTQRRQRRVPGGSTARINVRTTEAVHTELSRRAEQAKLSVPRYLVESGLSDPSSGSSLRSRRWVAERLETVEVRLVRIGTNLNQMATRLAATDRLDTGLAGALGYHQDTLQQLRALLELLDPPRP